MEHKCKLTSSQIIQFRAEISFNIAWWTQRQIQAASIIDEPLAAVDQTNLLTSTCAKITYTQNPVGPYWLFGSAMGS